MWNECRNSVLCGERGSLRRLGARGGNKRAWRRQWGSGLEATQTQAERQRFELVELVSSARYKQMHGVIPFKIKFVNNYGNDTLGDLLFCVEFLLIRGQFHKVTLIGRSQPQSLCVSLHRTGSNRHPQPTTTTKEGQHSRLCSPPPPPPLTTLALGSSLSSITLCFNSTLIPCISALIRLLLSALCSLPSALCSDRSDKHRGDQSNSTRLSHIAAISTPFKPHD